MLRAFFLPEFKRSLIQKLLIVVPALVLLLVSERLLATFGPSNAARTIGTPDFVINSLLSVLIVLSGFITGGAAFSRINEKHLPFIHSLPMSRLEIWTGLITVHFTTSLLMLPVILAMRPSLWTQSVEGYPADSLILTIAVYVVLFGAGACFVMLFRTIVIATPIGALITGSSLTISALFAQTTKFDWNGYHRVYGIPESSGGLNATFLIGSCLLLALLYLGLSLRFFVKGELNLPGRRIRNWASVAAAIAIFPLALSAAIETGTIGSNDDRFVAVVSPNGKYLAVLTARRDWGLGSDIAIIDTETGVATGSRSLYGVIDVEWSMTKPVLNVTTMQSPLWRLGYLLPPSDTILRLSAEGKVLDRVRLPFTIVDTTVADRPGRLLLAGTRGNRSKLFSLDDSSALHELVDTPKKDSLRLQPIQSRYYFLIRSIQNGLEHAWSVEETAREIPYSPRDKVRAQGTFLFDDGWYSERAASVEYARRFPLDSKFQARVTKDVVVSYLVPYDTYVSVPNEQSFVVLTNRTSGERTLLAFSKQTGWQALGELDTIRSLALVKLQPITKFDAQVLTEGLVLFRKKDSKSVTLYDGRLSRTLELTSEEPGQLPASCGWAQRVRTLEGAYIPCSPNAFFYRSNGEILPIPKVPQTLLYIDERGRHIHRTRDAIIRVNPDGTERKLWPMR